MAPPKKTTPPNAPSPADDDWMVEGVVGDDDWMAEGVEGADVPPPPQAPPAVQPQPASTGPTFYVRDAQGGLQPVSYDNALRANAAGLKVLSEAEVRALLDAAKAPPAAPAEAKPPADPGAWDTIVHNLGQGFFKQGYDELAGAMGRARSDTLGSGLRMPDGSVRFMKTEGDTYRVPRDREREVERGGREHRPVTAFLANMAGDIAGDVGLSALGVPVASTPYQVASGALSGLLGSDAELSTDNVQGSDVASAAGSTVLGGGLGYVLPKVGTQVARFLPGAMASLRQGLENKALDKVKKVLTSGSGQLARRKPVSNEAAREALDSSAIPIWGTTQGAFERLKELAETRGKSYADILDELEAAGVPGPEVEVLAQRLAKEGADRRANTGANKSIASVFENEAANIRNVAPEGPAVPPPAPTPPVVDAPAIAPAAGPVTERPVGPLPVRAAPVWTPAGADATKAGRPRDMPETPAPSKPAPKDATPSAKASRLPLSQAERIKRALQAEARFDKIQATGLDEAKQEVSSMYREAIEKAIEGAGEEAPPGSEVAGLAERFIPTKRQLARTLEARDAAERGAGAAAHRVGGAAGVNFFDLANVKQATGVDGLGGMLLAGAGRIWKERGPSTLANVYDVGAEAAGNLGRYAAARPERTAELVTRAAAPSARQFAGSSTVEEFLAEYLRRRQSGSGN